MSYQYPEIRKFLGLFAQANSFDLPDGAMEQTTNIIIQNDNTVDKLPGFYAYFNADINTLVNLHNYQDKLLAAFTGKLSYFTDIGSAPNVTGVEHVLTGATFAVTSPLTARSVQQSGNFYVTSDNGVMKIDAYNGKIYKAGSPPALDIRGNFLAANGPIAGDTQVGYRALFGRRDVNANEILGAPSDFLFLSNSPQESVAWSRTTNVVTVTKVGHNLATGMTITVSASTGGADKVVDGTYTVASTPSSSTFTIASTAANTTGTLTYTVSREALLEISVPRELTDVTDAYFVQVFRTSASNASTAVPSVDFRLVEERPLTSAELTAGVVFYQDNTDDILITNAPELYTNPNSQEGELQANVRPPLTRDVTLFQNYVFYANATARQVLEVDVIAAGSLAANDYVEVKVDAVTRRYVAKTGVSNKTAMSQAVTNAGGNLSVSYSAHGFSNGWTVYVSNVTGGTLTAGTYFIVNAAAGSFQLSLTSGGSAIAYSAVTSLWFEAVTDGTYPVFYLDNTSSSVSVQLRDTAEGIVKAVNRDSASLVYANYISAVDDTPGKMELTAVGFTGVIYARANSSGAGNAFAPTLPSSFASGTQVYSTGSVQQNAVFISKVGEPEAVPIVNSLQIGSKNKAIQRILALRDSVIVLKDDGVFKIVGDNPQNFTSVVLDNTVNIIAAASAALLNNQVYFLANQGICVATDSAVQILSRRIEKLIEPIIGNSQVATQTAAVGYESNRTYRISTIEPNSTDNLTDVTYIHNTINDTWTDSDILFRAGVVGPNNTLFLVSTGNYIIKERKSGDRTDYCMQNHTVAVQSASGSIATVFTVSYTPQVGDIIVKGTVINRVRSVAVNGPYYDLTFAQDSNLAALDSVTGYERLVSTWKMAPFHAGMVGRNKQFCQLILSTRTSNITRLQITFTGPFFGGSEPTEWVNTNIGGATGGWGYMPWGYFPWGLSDSTNIQTTTQPADPIRVLVPAVQQRGTYIQPLFVHEEAGESLDLQALTWAVRAYGERVSR